MRHVRPILLTACAALLLAPAGASAAEVEEGTTKLILERNTLAAFTTLGVRVGNDVPALVAGRRSITFPITGGDVSPTSGGGFLSHRGGLVLRRGSRTLTLGFLRLRLKNGGTLTARVGGERLTVASVITRGRRIRRRGIDTLVTDVKLNLTSTAARAIERAMGVEGLYAGMRLGRVSTTMAYRDVLVDAGGTTVAFDDGFGARLAAEGIGTSALPRTEVRPQGLLFPIVSGTVGRSSVTGRLRHLGGLALVRGDVRVALERPDLDLRASGELTALVGTARVPLATVDVSGATAEPGDATEPFVVRSVGLKLTATAAQAINGAFGSTAFAEGQPLGTALVWAKAR